MTTAELQTLRDNRLEGESLNDTKDRLAKEGKLVPSRNLLPGSSCAGDEEGFFPDDLVIPRSTSAAI